MVRQQKDQKVTAGPIRNGIGDVENRSILNGAEEMYGKGRMFSILTIDPGNSIGKHVHSGDNEIFYVLSGSGEYDDNGTLVNVERGDTMVCNDGEAHGFVNTGKEPLVLAALILYS